MKMVWCLPALLLAGCANLPQVEQVGEFGKATTAASSFAKDSITANRAIALRIDDERLANKFITGQFCPLEGEPGFSDQCKATKFVLAGSVADVLRPDSTGQRLRALAALGEYGDALAKAVDQGQIDKLELAAANVGNAAVSLTPLFPPVSPVAAPAIRLAARGFGYALSSAYIAEIKAIVKASDDDIKKLTDLLKTDFRKLAGLLGGQVDAYERARRANLSAMRHGNEIDRLRLYTDFKGARQDYAAVQSLALAAKKFVSIFDAIAETHNALATNKPDAELFLRRLIALIGDATELVKAAKLEKAEKGS